MVRVIFALAAVFAGKVKVAKTIAAAKGVGTISRADLLGVGVRGADLLRGGGARLLCGNHIAAGVVLDAEGTAGITTFTSLLELAQAGLGNEHRALGEIHGALAMYS